MRKKIYIIDDDIMTLRILKSYLEEEYEVQTENDVFRFLDAIGSTDADMILIDVKMPDMSGFQVYDEVKKHPALASKPVLFLTGTSGLNQVSDTIGYSEADYIMKSIPKEELLERIDAVFKARSGNNGVKSILMLESNMECLKSMKDTLERENYNVIAVNTVMDMVENVGKKHPQLVIIGNDISGNNPRKLFDDCESILRNEKIPAIVMDSPFFTEELLEKVESIFAE